MADCRWLSASHRCDQDEDAGFQIVIAGSDRFKATDISFPGGNFRWRFVAGVK
jgi:hypothetical protein